MDRGDVRTSTFQASASAAESRAEECRRRLADLQGSGPSVGTFDAALARDRLDRARSRAAAAERRLAEAIRNHGALGVLREMGPRGGATGTDLPALLGALPTPLRAAQICAWMENGALTLTDLWLAFMSLGGRADLMELDAYLHGAWTMSGRDRSILEHACWEYDSFGRLGET